MKDYDKDNQTKATLNHNTFVWILEFQALADLYVILKLLKSYLWLVGRILQMGKEEHKMAFKQQNNGLIAYDTIPRASLILAWVNKIIIGPWLSHSFKYSKNCKQ